MSFRWTLEALQAFEKRKEQWQKDGKVTTHTIAAKGESNVLNRRGGRKPKYGNIKAEAEGMTFHSKKERGRWMDLRLMERAGEIRELQRQIKYPLEVNGIHVGDYIADMVYDKNGLVVEDVKGYQTDIYRLKKKLMLACHGIEILET